MILNECSSCNTKTLFGEDCVGCFMRSRKKNTTIFNPTILSDKIIDAINDTSITTPEPVGSKTESDLKEFVKDLLITEQLVALREFMSEYRIPCNCISMEYTCLGHQLGDIFDLEDEFPNPTEYKKYPSLWHLFPKVPMKRKGYRDIPKKEGGQ